MGKFVGVSLEMDLQVALGSEPMIILKLFEKCDLGHMNELTYCRKHCTYKASRPYATSHGSAKPSLTQRLFRNNDIYA